MAIVASLADFRATLRLTQAGLGGCGEKVFTYWNNEGVTPESCDCEEVLHLVRDGDGSFRLEIANLLHRGSLEELESILYEWARDEGWFD